MLEQSCGIPLPPWASINRQNLRHFYLLYLYDSKKALYAFLFEFPALCQGGYLLTSIFKRSMEFIYSADAESIIG